MKPPPPALACQEFLIALEFIVLDTKRDPEFINNHLLSYLAQDFIQSAVALPVLANNGILNVCRRELRFILEASIKLCFIQQNGADLKISEKLVDFKQTLDSSKITVKKDLNLWMLQEPHQNSFKEEIGRFYGDTSGYVHMSSDQILERIALVDAGRTSGYENDEDVSSLSLTIVKGLSYSLVLLLHSVYEYVAGDFLVESDGTSNPWIFEGSKYIALIDEHFDYKHERQQILHDVKTRRAERIYF